MIKEIELTHSQKIALLEAIKRGSLDLGIFGNLNDEPETDEEIIKELVRLEKLGNPRKHVELMTKWINGDLTDNEYIAERLKYNV